MQKSFLAIILIMLISVPLFASNNTNVNININKDITGTDSTENNKPGNEKKYVEAFNSTFTIRPFIQLSTLAINIKHYETKTITNDNNETTDRKEYSDTIEYVPNVMTAAGFSLTYHDFGISLSRNLPRTAKNEDTYGNSVYTDFQFYYFARKFGVELFYQRYRGYYLNKPETFDYQVGDPETIRSDIKTMNVGLNAFYIFSNNFSFNASFNQSERQMLWDWTILVMVSASHYVVDGNYSLIPEDQEQYYGEEAGFERGTFTSIGVAPGIAITKPFRSLWFITAAAFLGTGFMNKRYDVAAGNKSINESYIKANVKLATGYNGNKYFFGIYGLMDANSSEKIGKGEGIGVAAVSYLVQLFGGMRI